MAEATITKIRRKNSKYENFVLNIPKALATANNFGDKTECEIFQYGADLMIRVKK